MTEEKENMPQSMIHPTAIIDPQAEIGPGVKIGPYAVIGPHVKIGAGTEVMAHVTIDDRRKLPFLPELFYWVGTTGFKISW